MSEKATSSATIAHSSGVRCNLLGLMCHLSCVTSHISGIMCQVPCVRCHLSGVRCDVLSAMCRVSGVRCQVSGVRCQVSPVKSRRRQQPETLTWNKNHLSHPIVASSDNRASTQSRFTHVTTNTWARSKVFGFFRFIFGWKKMPPLAKSHFENTMGNPFFSFFF